MTFYSHRRGAAEDLCEKDDALYRHRPPSLVFFADSRSQKRSVQVVKFFESHESCPGELERLCRLLSVAIEQLEEVDVVAGQV